jgi:hypothetical protein
MSASGGGVERKEEEGEVDQIFRLLREASERERREERSRDRERRRLTEKLGCVLTLSNIVS